MLEKIDSFFYKVFQVLEWIAVVFLLSATAVTAFNAITRYTFNFVLFGNEEICSYLVLTLVFLCFPVMEGKDKMLCIGLLNKPISKYPKLRTGLTIFRGILTIGVCTLMVNWGIKIAKLAFYLDTTTMMLLMPKGIFFAVTATSFAIAALVWIVILFLRKGAFFK